MHYLIFRAKRATRVALGQQTRRKGKADESCCPPPTGSKHPQQRYPRFSRFLACQDRWSGRRHPVAGRYVPGILRRFEFPLAACHTDKLKLSFLLFDEIEKASDALWQLLLGMLDKATLTLGDNRRVDLSQTVIFLTSNLGGGEITELMQGGMGFIQPADKPA